MIRLFLTCIGILATLGVAAGFGGWLHPAGDSAALLRPVLAALCLSLLIGVRQVWVRRAMFAAIIASAVTVLPPFFGQTGERDLRLYSKNLWWDNGQLANVARDIQVADVDVVMLQEVSDDNYALLALLKQDFPHQHVCDYSRWSDLAVLSRTPFAGTPECTDARGVAFAPLRVDGDLIWVGSVHVPWPWPYKSAASEADIAQLLSGVDTPVVLAGDFNIFPWTARMNRIRRQSGTQFAGPTRPTLTYRRMPLPIDHVLAPGGGTVERRGLLGSDHRGLVADVSLDR